MPKSQEKMIAKTKWICPGQHNEKGQIKEELQKKKMKDTKSRIVDSDP
jgi:hypothetical protein